MQGRQATGAKPQGTSVGPNPQFSHLCLCGCSFILTPDTDAPRREERFEIFSLHFLLTFQGPGPLFIFTPREQGVGG